MSEASTVPQTADLGAWLAAAAGTIGALMATLDTSIVSASLPTIQGEIGASGAEGTWITTAYLVAEIVMIPIAGWLSKIFGLRTFLLIVTALFTAFSMMCGVSHDLGQMIIGRIGQGFTGGAMIPMALIIVATRLPPRQQPLGIALFGMTAVLGPVLGPVIGGWMTEHLSWHYAFFLNLPIGVGLLALLTLGLTGARPHWEMFAEADLLGLVGLTLGLGGRRPPPSSAAARPAILTTRPSTPSGRTSAEPRRPQACLQPVPRRSPHERSVRRQRRRRKSGAPPPPA